MDQEREDYADRGSGPLWLPSLETLAGIGVVFVLGAAMVIAMLVTLILLAPRRTTDPAD